MVRKGQARVGQFTSLFISSGVGINLVVVYPPEGEKWFALAGKYQSF